jgi:hypothetical protein
MSMPYLTTWHGGGIRPALVNELPLLQQIIDGSAEDKLKLYAEVNTPEGKQILPLVVLHVAEQDGQLCGMLPLRLIWQAEPLMIWTENQSLRRRIALGLGRAVESYVGNRTINKTGIYSYFFVTNEPEWGKLAEHSGCLRLYRECATYGRDL